MLGSAILSYSGQKGGTVTNFADPFVRDVGRKRARQGNRGEPRQEEQEGQKEKEEILF